MSQIAQYKWSDACTNVFDRKWMYTTYGGSTASLTMPDFKMIIEKCQTIIASRNCYNEDGWAYQTSSNTLRNVLGSYAVSTSVTWNDICTNNTWTDSLYYYYPQDPKDALREQIHNRMLPYIKTSKSLRRTEDIREQRARETLHRVIGDLNYRKFLAKGHISIRSKSGKIYQIFPAHGITNVYTQGKMVERLCVVLQGSFAATDSLIMRYLLILNNEEQFRKLAVKHSVNTYLRDKTYREDQNILKFTEQQNRNLIDIYRDLKQVG